MADVKDLMNLPEEIGGGRYYKKNKKRFQVRKIEMSIHFHCVADHGHMIENLIKMLIFQI